jgi:3-hydroxyisobutyrate dehydrogenase
MKVGFIGLGTMGGPMALNARTKGGFEMIVHDLRREASLPHVEAGARWSDDIASLAREVDVVLTSLPGPREMYGSARGRASACMAIAYDHVTPEEHSLGGR